MKLVACKPVRIATQQNLICAICAEPTSLEQSAREILDGKTVRVCRGCTYDHPRSGRYNFGGGRGSSLTTGAKGVGAGNSRKGGKHG